MTWRLAPTVKRTWSISQTAITEKIFILPFQEFSLPPFKTRNWGESFMPSNSFNTILCVTLQQLIKSFMRSNWQLIWRCLIFMHYSFNELFQIVSRSFTVIRKIINIFNIVFIVAETLIYKYKYSNCRMAVGVGRVNLKVLQRSNLQFGPSTFNFKMILFKSF